MHDGAMTAAYRAVTFDLLSALVDSRSLFETVAGDGAAGGRWREAQLRLVAASGNYRPFEQIVTEAAREAGVGAALAGQLLAQWGQIQPYPDSSTVLTRLSGSGLTLLILTNSSQRLAELVAAKLPIRWHAVVSAEAAGAYKPDPRAYAAGCRAAGSAAAEILFVPGSAQDLRGATQAGHPTYWVNRRSLPAPPGVHPIAIEPALDGLPRLLGL